MSFTTVVSLFALASCSGLCYFFSGRGGRRVRVSAIRAMVGILVSAPFLFTLVGMTLILGLSNIAIFPRFRNENVFVLKQMPQMTRKKPAMSLKKKDETPFLFFSGTEYDTAYELAMSEMVLNTPNGSFIAGAGWTQLWTRDTAYAVELGAGLVNPVASKASILSCTEVDDSIGVVWFQDDCKHFGGWPILSDSIVGAQGSWAYYLFTGDLDFLEWAFDITRNTLLRAERDAHDAHSGLFKGCSSFMESNSGYPSSFDMNGTKVGQSKALSTNVLYYNGYRLAAKMAQELGVAASIIQDLDNNAIKLRDAIRSRLWLPRDGYYSYFERDNGSIVRQMEGLGESLVLLSPDFENDTERINSIFANTPTTEHGLPCLWPQFNIRERKSIGTYYHNGRIWPFVQGYWAMAASRHNQIDIFAKEFANLLYLSQQKNTFAEFYNLDGTFHEIRSRQLWSNTGYISMVYHGLFGMIFQVDGIQFNPTKPEHPFSYTISLKNVKYRDLILDIYVKGFGSKIKSFKLNSIVTGAAFVSNKMTGRHTVEILLKGGA